MMASYSLYVLEFMRRVMRVMGTIVPTLLRLLSIPKIAFQKPCIIVLYNLTLEGIAASYAFKLICIQTKGWTC